MTSLKLLWKLVVETCSFLFVYLYLYEYLFHMYVNVTFDMSDVHVVTPLV